MTSVSNISGSNAERSRASNRQAVLGRIQSVGPMGRAEIARSLGLSTQAVSNIIADLTQDGLLLEAGTRSGTRGLPAVQYDVNPKGGYAFGLEIRPDAIFASIVDLRGNVVNTRRLALTHNEPVRVVLDVIKLRADLTAKAEIVDEKLMGAGIVIPGPFGKTGLSGLGSDLTGWENIDARAMFADALGLPVELSNDANAAAMSERITQKIDSFAYLYFGAGLGLGLVNQGQLVVGAFGNAGEIGHIQVMTHNGPAPLEQQLSRVSIQTHMRSKTPLDFNAIETLFTQKDQRFMTWLETSSAALSQAVALLENLFDPQTVILGGAMPEAVLDHLISHTDLAELSVSNRSDNPIPRIQRGKCGRMTATLGAASLILNRVFTPQAASL